MTATPDDDLDAAADAALADGLVEAVDTDDDIAMAEPLPETRNRGEIITDDLLAMARQNHDWAWQALIDARAQRDALNDEIRLLVDAEDRARRALRIFTKGVK